MESPGIYKIQSIVKPDRIYVGSATNIEKRWGVHLCRLRTNTHHSKKLQNHYNKYGESDLQFSILLGCDKEDLIKTEQYFIDSHNPWFNVNITAGSRLGVLHTEKSKKQMSITRKETYKTHPPRKGFHHSEEQKKRISEGHKGQKAWNKGLSKETDKRILAYSITRKEKHYSYISNRKGKKHSEESKQKMSESRKGRVPWNKGKKGVYSSETLLKIGISGKGRTPWNKGKKGWIIPWNKGLKGVLIPWNKGKKATPEAIKHQSESHIGKTPWNKGISCSEKTKQKIRQSIKKDQK
jgi:group I intron endonuclease